MQNTVRVYFDDISIWAYRDDETHQSIRWSDLAAVQIQTTDQGPFAEDVFFILVGDDSQPDCVIPQGATGEYELFLAMQKRLAGFDNEKVIEAMQSTENKMFLVWKRF